jgi:hypothetical protein
MSRKSGSQEPGERYSPEPNRLETTAAIYLGRYADRPRKDGRDHAAALRRTTRWAVGLAIAAGIVSGGIIGGSEIWLRQVVLGGGEDAGFIENWPVWLGWFAVAGVVSAIEIAFLYWVSVRGIARIVQTSHVELGERGYHGLFARGLARAALEFPNPQVGIFGIDPYAHVSKWRLFVRNVVYKLKVGVSSFVLRVFLRRIAARMAVRGIVPLMAGPLYAAWNAIIVWRIIAEARIRAYGPPAIDEMLDRCLGDGDGGGEALSEAGRTVLLHGVGELTARAGDAHPNYVYLIARLRERLGNDADEIEVDWPAQRDSLAELGEDERERILGMLTLAAVVGSRTQGKQRELIDDAYAACGLQRGRKAFKELRRDLADGRLSVPDTLATAATPRKDAA